MAYVAVLELVVRVSKLFYVSELCFDNIVIIIGIDIDMVYWSLLAIGIRGIIVLDNILFVIQNIVKQDNLRRVIGVAITIRFEYIVPVVVQYIFKVCVPLVIEDLVA